MNGYERKCFIYWIFILFWWHSFTALCIHYYTQRSFFFNEKNEKFSENLK